MNTRLLASHAAGWFFGIVFFTMGAINCFWGNDAGFGIFISMLSFIFLPPVNDWVRLKTGLIIPLWLKVLTGLGIAWAAVGVGEIFTKIDRMLLDL